RLAELLDLLAIGPHARSPRAQRGVSRRAQRVGGHWATRLTTVRAKDSTENGSYAGELTKASPASRYARAAGSLRLSRKASRSAYERKYRKSMNASRGM